MHGSKPTADPRDKLDFKRVLPIFIIVLIDLLGLTIIIPLLPLYAASFGASPLVIGALGTTYPLMQLIGGPLLGGLSDRYGRKPVLIVSQIGTLIGFIILGLANALPLLFLSRIIDGLSGANIVVAQAAITDSTNERTRAQGLGLIGAAFGLGFTLGPAIAGIALVASGNDYRVPAFLAAGFSLISILLTTFWFHETHPAEKRAQAASGTPTGNRLTRTLAALRNPLIGALLLLIFLQQLVFGGFENLLALFTLNRLGMGASSNAALFVFVGVLLVLVQGKYIGPWSRKYGERKLIYAGLALLAVGLTLASITPPQPVPWYSQSALLEELSSSARHETIAVALPQDDSTGWLGLVWMLVAMVPTTIGGGILAPSINSMITKRISPTQIGSMLGVSSSLVSAANAITPLIGGALFQIMGSTAPFLIGGLVMAALVVFATRRIAPHTSESLTSTSSGSPA